MDNLGRYDVPTDNTDTKNDSKTTSEADSRLVRFSVAQKPPKNSSSQDLLERAAMAALGMGTRRAIKNSQSDKTDVSDFLPIPSPGITPRTPRGRSPNQPTSPNKSSGRISFRLPSAETYSWKHPEYAFTRHSRTFLCGYDTHSYSQNAMDWLLGELVEDGDEVVALWAVEVDEREKAEKALNSLVEQSVVQAGKKVSIVLEYAIGKFQQVLEPTIEIYEPSILVVGTKGRKKVGFQGLIPGSISQYCLQHSPIPVIVVKPHQKRAKTRAKRTKKDKRAYMNVLQGVGDWKLYEEAATESDKGRQPPILPSGWNEGYDDVRLDRQPRRKSL